MVSNLLLEDVQYEIVETSWGVWRRFLYPSGQLYAEFVSHRSFRGWPLLHFTRGICPETGHRKVARGVIAIGRLAVGGVAIGHASAGIVAIGQASLGAVFALGQAACACAAVGQLAIAVGLGIGQFAFGHVAIGQVGIGRYVLGQTGYGMYLWTQQVRMPEAVSFFTSLWPG